MQFSIVCETPKRREAKSLLIKHCSSTIMATHRSLFDSPMRSASPFDAIYRAVAPRGGFGGQAFRLRFMPFALSQFVPGAWSFLLLLWQGPQEWRIWLTVLLALKVTGGGVLVAAIVSRCFPVIANARGLRARNFWGQAREVAWEDISEVKPIRWLIWTDFVRISTKESRNIVWLPLFLREQNAFEDKIKQWAPLENPLRVFFENRAQNE